LTKNKYKTINRNLTLGFQHTEAMHENRSGSSDTNTSHIEEN